MPNNNPGKDKSQQPSELLVLITTDSKFCCYLATHITSSAYSITLYTTDNLITIGVHEIIREDFKNILGLFCI